MDILFNLGGHLLFVFVLVDKTVKTKIYHYIERYTY